MQPAHIGNQLVGGKTWAACRAAVRASLQPEHWTVSGRLVLIVAAVALPLNILIIIVISTLANAASDAQRASLFYTAHSVAASLDGRLSKYIAIGQSLLRSASLKANNLPAFDTEARQALAGVPDAWVMLADQNGNELVNTSITAGKPLPSRSVEGLSAQEQAQRSGNIVVSNVHRNRTEDWVVTIDIPVGGKSAPAAELVVAMSAPSFLKLLNAQAIPDGWLAGIIDRTGRFVARVPDNSAHIGQPASVGWQSIMRQEGIFEFASLDGDQIVQGNVLSAASGWAVGIAVRKSSLLSTAWGTVRWAVLLGSALSGIGLLLATLIGRSITDPLRMLRSGAGNIVSGAPIRLRQAPPEIVELGGALQRAFDDRQQSEAALNRVSARLAAIITSSSDAILSKTLDGTITSWNESAERLFDYSAKEMIGQSILTIIPAGKREEEADILSRLRSGERIRQYDTTRLHKSGRVIDVSVSISPVRDPNGELAGASTIIHDITEMKAKDLELRMNQERQNQILNTVNAYVGLIDSNGRLVEVNAGAVEAAGVPRESLLGMPMADAPWWRVTPDVKKRMGEIIARCLAGETVRCDLKYATGTDEVRWIDFQATPIISEGGKVTAAVPSGVDITERKRAEEQVRILMMEVNHRSKNMLGLVLSIARQTSATNFQEFMARFSERIFALSANLDLLVRNDWQGIDIEDLARAQLAHLADLQGGRVAIAGPKLRLTSAAAQAIGMALHELGTNAVSYGALSVAAGRVDLEWRLEGDDLTVSWVERNGPAIQKPARSGFGSSIMTTLLERSVTGTVDMDYAGAGLSWHLRCPSANVLENISA